jgi:hypothetical protein
MVVDEWTHLYETLETFLGPIRILGAKVVFGGLCKIWDVTLYLTVFDILQSGD